MNCCPRLPEEETYRTIETAAVAETAPLLDRAIAELTATLNEEQRKLLTTVEDLHTQQLGAVIDEALKYKRCCHVP